MTYTSNGQLCLEFSELVPGAMSKAAYDQAKARDQIIVHGRGGNGGGVMIEFESLSPKHKKIANELFGGDVYAYYAKLPLLKMVKRDDVARDFFANKYALPDGRPLPLPYQAVYCRQCDWLNMISNILADKRQLKEQLRITMGQFWENVAALHKNDKPINPELPTSEKRLRMKLNAYQEKGYTSLIEEWRFTQENARIVDASIEKLLLSLYCPTDGTKPSFADVARRYNEFMRGLRQVVDMKTGEVFEPDTYLVDGKPYEVKVETVKHYINKPINRAIADKVRMSALQYATAHRPYMQRDKPHYSFSMITMDDTSSPFKMQDGKRPSTYKVFDVASEAIISMEMQRGAPDVAMVRRLHAKMFQLIIQKGWVMPAEVQVEQHLNSDMKGKENAQGLLVDDILTAGAAYAFVSFCASRNPQEKLAEHVINRYKYYVQAERSGFQRRPFAKSERYRMNDDSDSHKMRFTYDQIEQMEREDVEIWNNQLHTDQKKFKGLTRWQVLEMHQNPDLSRPNLPLVMPYIGNRTATSIRRGYIQVNYDSYRLPDISMLETLVTDQLTAYWVPNEDGNVPQVYLYQDGRYVCTAPVVERFQVAKAEQTDADKEKFGRQQGYVKGFDKLINEGLGNMPRTGTIRTQVAATEKAEWQREDVEAEQQAEEVYALKLRENVQKKQPKQGGYMQNADSWDTDFFSPEAIKSRAISGL